MKKLLLHCCCAPDATAVGSLIEEYDVSLSFYNPNIQPPEEYDLRLRELDKVSKFWNLPILPVEYDPELWNRLAWEYREGMERSERCRICFSMRLEETARLALEGGFDCFGTVLTVSPHKNAAWILEAGRAAAQKFGLSFLERDFKKGGGYQNTVQVSRELGIWRQNYCGCLYSLWQRQEEDRLRFVYREKLSKRLKEHLPSLFARLLIMREKELLLVRRGQKWGLPFGPVMPGEKIKDAVARIAGEHGVRVNEIALRGIEELFGRDGENLRDHRVILDHACKYTASREALSFEGLWCGSADVERLSAEMESPHLIKKHLVTNE
ncbi:MAG TPA: epoxyqueuosine reductase QueH [Chroococcales cyanobacterium]